MLRVTLEMVPFGNEEKKRLIGKMEISNVYGDSEFADYTIKMVECDFKEAGKIKGFTRCRGAWNLVKEAMNSMKFNK